MNCGFVNIAELSEFLSARPLGGSRIYAVIRAALTEYAIAIDTIYNKKKFVDEVKDLQPLSVVLIENILGNIVDETRRSDFNVAKKSTDDVSTRYTTHLPVGPQGIDVSGATDVTVLISNRPVLAWEDKLIKASPKSNRMVFAPKYNAQIAVETQACGEEFKSKMGVEAPLIYGVLTSGRQFLFFRRAYSEGFFLNSLIGEGLDIREHFDLLCLTLTCIFENVLELGILITKKNSIPETDEVPEFDADCDPHTDNPDRDDPKDGDDSNGRSEDGDQNEKVGKPSAFSGSSYQAQSLSVAQKFNRLQMGKPSGGKLTQAALASHSNRLLQQRLMYPKNY